MLSQTRTSLSVTINGLSLSSGRQSLHRSQKRENKIVDQIQTYRCVYYRNNNNVLTIKDEILAQIKLRISY